MKKVLMALLCLASLYSFAQTETKELNADSLAYEIVQLPDSTGKGFPNGNTIRKEIGAEGGRIVSEDGRVELIFPEGALTTKTNISIQPIISPIPNANGNGYQFEPSGTKFLKPVELVFHYKKEDEAQCPALFMFMAIQSDNGKWEYMDYDDWDSTKQVLKGTIYHFSAMVNGKLVELNKEKVTLKVGQNGVFFVQQVLPPYPGPAVPGDEDITLPSIPSLGKEKAEWNVNGIKGGNSIIGTVNAQKDPRKAIYTAPNLLNNDEFMTVELKTYIIVNDEKTTNFGKKKGKMIKYGSHREYLASLTCQVQLYDEYRLTILVDGPSILTCGATLRDVSSFDVKLFNKKAVISGLENHGPELKDPPNCPPLKYDAAGCVGPVHYNRNLLESYEFKAYPEVVEMKFTPIGVKVMNSSGRFNGEKKDFPGGDLDTNVGNDLRFRASRTYQSYEFGLVDDGKEGGKEGRKKGGKKSGKEGPKVAGKNGYVLYVYPL